MLEAFSDEARAALTEQEMLELLQLDYFRKHLDVYIEYAFPKIRLKRIQKTIARAIGNNWNIKVCFSRGGGKTWLIAVVVAALAQLYPGTVIFVVSATIEKAQQVLEKIKQLASLDENFALEIKPEGRQLIHLDKSGGHVAFWNDSTIEVSSINNMRSHRAKIIVRDEEIEINQEMVRPIVTPVLNYIRDVAITYGFEDYPSKSISITSCCEQSNGFFNEFMKTYNAFAEYRRGCFACCLDYQCAIDNGINSQSYFDNIIESHEFTHEQFAQEFGSFFLAAVQGSVLPYSLTDPCRTLRSVEVAQAKNSKARYVIGVDIATSSARTADNSIIAVLKFREMQDGHYARKLVFMQSFHGDSVDKLAKRVQELYHISFPNAEKIIYDARGVGDSFAIFCNNEFLDLVTGKEYPPLVVDDQVNYNNAAIPALHPFRAINALNQRIYNNLLVALERRTIELPIHSRELASSLDEFHKLPLEERSIFTEADALQSEMSHIVCIEGKRDKIYDTPNLRHHKDRYSALAMANDYISELEKATFNNQPKSFAIGLCSDF